MSMQSVSLSALEPASANPRRKITRASIEGLAASIKTDGVLHNLVVSPIKSKGKQERFQVVIGSRRFEALRLLEQRGELPEDFKVKVEVRDNLSKDQTLRIATVENLQRQNMTPLDEAAALCKLVHIDKATKLCLDQYPQIADRVRALRKLSTDIECRLYLSLRPFSRDFVLVLETETIRRLGELECKISIEYFDDEGAGHDIDLQETKPKNN